MSEQEFTGDWAESQCPRTFWWTFGIVLTCLTVVFVVGAHWQLGANTESSFWTYKTYEIKHGIAEQQPSPRIFVVGGSSVLYGIRCAQLRDALGVPCINMGVNAQLRSRLIIQQATRLARRGDTIILALEYDQYHDDGLPNNVLIDYVFAREPGYFSHLPWTSRLAFISRLSLQRWAEGLRRSGRDSEKHLNVQYNERYRLSDCGDYLDNTFDNQSAALLAKLQKYGPQESIGGTVSDYVKQELHLLAAECQERGIRLLATWPPVIRFQTYETQEALAFFGSIREAYLEVAIPVIGRPDSAFFEWNQFFDTEDHLNSSAAALHTAKLIQELSTLSVTEHGTR